ncbi:MAG: M20/M25/M40 family metallo-hydrolase [Anaerolineales bacterium]|nr:M20/M25/M40 family metallo-hydrolase [Anaerolineales bacterium]
MSEKPSAGAAVKSTAPTKSRITTIDIIRGFAIFGILVFNVSSFSGQPRTLDSWQEPLDRAIFLATRFFVEAKFYSMFSFLFGWGIAVQYARAKERGMKFTSFFVRRMSILLLFGLLHGIFIWSGDILATYAAFGFLLLLFFSRSNRTLLIGTALFLLLSIILVLPGELMDTFRNWYFELTDFLRSDTYSRDLYATGAYWEITKLRFQEIRNGNSQFIYHFGNIFSMFLLGMYVARRKILHNVEQNKSLLQKVMWIGLVIGIIFNTIFTLTFALPQGFFQGYHRFVLVSSRTIGAPALMLFYVSSIVLLLQKKSWQLRLSPLTPIGRMSLSNYIFQSIVGTLIFYSYGLGLYGQVDLTTLLILTILMFLLQIRLSDAWSDRYQFGPLEWLWRTLTYGKRQPIHIGQSPEDVRPVSLYQRIQERVRRINPIYTLAIAWAIIIPWAILLILWNNHLANRIPSSSQEEVQPTDQTALTLPEGSLEQSQSAPDDQPSIIATPVVQAVELDPSTIVASGDLHSLASAYDVAESLSQIESLTGPPYNGRLAGSPQGYAAGNYIARQFERFGLQPAGDDGTFFQTFGIDHIAYEGSPTLTIETPDGNILDYYVMSRDFTPLVRRYVGKGQGSGEVIWMSNCEHDDFGDIDVVGKVVLCRYNQQSDAMRQALEHGASGLLLLIDQESMTIDFAIPRYEAWVPEPLPTYWISPAVAEDLLIGRDEMVEDLSLIFTPFPLETKVDMSVDFAGPEACGNAGCVGRNVLGVLPGRDPEYADEVVIVGGHYDHMGETPGGIVWAGANDDASGIAVFLEIARSWHEQGFVPRRTVLFAAWDAEEIGLLGATHYVHNPRYSLDNTIAMIQLDMVGAGLEILEVDGDTPLGEQIQHLAESMDLEVAFTNHGRSDHGPFLMAGVQANMLGWGHDPEAPLTYHRPVDTPDAIDLERLESIGYITGLTILGLVEGEPAINDLLAQRAEAVVQNDVNQFLATSTTSQVDFDRYWFNEVTTFSPTDFEMYTDTVNFTENGASAFVQMDLTYPGSDTDESARTTTSSLQTRFELSQSGWKWAGPDLVEVEPVQEDDPEIIDNDGQFIIMAPEEEIEDLGDLSQRTAELYGEISERLNLSADGNASILLLPSHEALRASTALSLTRSLESWVDQNTIKITYEDNIDDSRSLIEALIQFRLAQSGISETSAPWLWNGLPLVLGDELDVENGDEYLPRLSQSYSDDQRPIGPVADWAAVAYLRNQIGWDGLGQMLTEIQHACIDRSCDEPIEFELALRRHLNQDSTSFNLAWESYWEERLSSIHSALESVLSTREQAIISRDLTTFLETVDTNVHSLLEEQEYWFSDLDGYSIEMFSYNAEPLIELQDEALLTEVTFNFRMINEEEEILQGSSTQEIVLIKDGDAYLWAGTLSTEISGDSITIHAPSGFEAIAADILIEAEAILEEITELLQFSDHGPVHIKLYGSSERFRNSISPVYPAFREIEAWCEEGSSLKIRLQSDLEAEGYVPLLAEYLTRHLLTESGVESEWFLEGVSTYIARNFDKGTIDRTISTHIIDAFRNISDNLPFTLSDFPTQETLDLDLSGEAAFIALDSVNYFIDVYGWEALLNSIQEQGRNQSIDDALQLTAGVSLDDLESDWLESFSTGHMNPEWVEVAYRFDSEQVSTHITALTDPALYGRQPGSEGAIMAADYVRDKFQEYGLLPIVIPFDTKIADEEAPVDSQDEISPEVGVEGEQDVNEVAPSYYQDFPIQYATVLSTPRLSLQKEGDPYTRVLQYREDFLTVPAVLRKGGKVEGELVWVQNLNYHDFNLEGKIVVLDPPENLADDVMFVEERGANGLILVGTRNKSVELLSKDPYPVQFPHDFSIPVLEFTEDGFTHLLSMIGLNRIELRAMPARPLGIRAQMEIPLSALSESFSSNVLGFLPGTDPNLSQYVVILSAPYDHVGDDPGSLICGGRPERTHGLTEDIMCEREGDLSYPGLNDSTSGIAVLLEIARILHEAGYQPKHSILFAAWGAHHSDSAGARYYVGSPVIPLDDTLAMIHLGPLASGLGYYLEGYYDWERESKIIFNLMMSEELVEGYLKRTTDEVSGDHSPFRNADVPAVFLKWEGASNRILPAVYEDEIDFDRLGITGRMVALTMMALAR